MVLVNNITTAIHISETQHIVSVDPETPFSPKHSDASYGIPAPSHKITEYVSAVGTFHQSHISCMLMIH